MGQSAPSLAKRALVRLVWTLGTLDSVVVDVTRDSTDDEVKKAFKKVFLRAHPDKGGSVEHSQQLNQAN